MPIKVGASIPLLTLDYTPGVFSVERQVRGKWACAACRTLLQTPVPPAIIDNGIPTSGLLAKHADHLPMYRQEAIFARAGLAIPRATLGNWVGQRAARLEPVAQALKAELMRCQVLHADETPVAMLEPPLNTEFSCACFIGENVHRSP